MLLVLLGAEAVSARSGSSLRLRLVRPDQTEIDLERYSFDQVRALIEEAPEGEWLELPLPFAGDSPLLPIEIESEVRIDPLKNTLVLAGRVDFRGLGGRAFLSATFPDHKGPGKYAFGVSPNGLVLEDWFPVLESTPLGQVEYEALGVVVASVKHQLPLSQLIADTLDVDNSEKDLEVEAGVMLHLKLATQSLPGVGAVLQSLGVEQGHYRVTGRVGSDVDLLLQEKDKDGKTEPKPLEVEFTAELEATAMAGIQRRLPDWIRPTSLAPKLTFGFKQPDFIGGEKGAEPKKPLFKVGLAFSVEADIGGESLEFGVSSEIEANRKDAKVTLKGETAWHQPLGIEWLDFKEASLELEVDNKGGDKKGAGSETWKATVSSLVQIGNAKAKYELEIERENKKGSDVKGKLTTSLERVSIGDLASFVSRCTGSSFLADLELGNAAQLEQVKLTFERSENKKTKKLENKLEATAIVQIAGSRSSVLLTYAADAKSKGKGDALFVVKRQAGHMSDLAPALRGNPGDLELPVSVWVLSPARAKAGARTLSSAELGSTAQAFFTDVYGPEFQLELQPGIHLGATLPVGKLPSALVQALGIQSTASLVLEGSLNMNLDLGQGRPSASLQSLELHAELPRMAGAGSRLPEGLPSWMRLESSSQRTLTLRYEAPSSVTFLQTNDVLAELDGQTRHFRIGTEVSADSKQGKARLSGSMVGEWRQPFGLKALNLRDVTLAVEGSATTGKGGKRSGGLLLEGGFDLGRKQGRMQLELAATSGKGVSGSFTGALDSFSLEDLSRIDLFPNLPREGLERLGTTLGKLPPLLEPTLHVALGGGQPSVSFSAHADLRGVLAHLLVFVHKGKKGPQAVVGLRPENFSLARLFPKLGQNPAVAPLANLTLDRFGLLAVLGDQTLKASEVEPEVRDFFVALTGDRDFELKLAEGLNLEANLAADKLPRELTQALDQLNKTMGVDSPATLNLRGTIGTSLADLRLAAALPPLSPVRAPRWLKSGQLAFVLTGTPSFMLTATLVVDCEGDLLNLSVEGGIERQGANVAIALKSALQAEDVWDSPFGLEWLEVRRFSGELSIDALANVGFGGGGNVTIGSKDIDVFAWTKVNAATLLPMGLVVKAESQAGLALLDLADLQGKMRKAAGLGGPKLLPLDQLPDIAVRDFALLIATRAVPDQGIDSPGFKLKGDLYIPLKPRAKGEKFAFVDCEVSKEGILAKGAIGSLTVGPLTWDDSFIDLEATLAAQHLNVHGRIELLGSSSETDLRLARDGLSFETSREIQGLGATHLLVESRFDLKKPTFHARGQLDNQFGEVFGQSVLGELTDVGGKAAAIGKLALDAVALKRAIRDNLRNTLGLPTATEFIDAVALKRVRDAEAAAAAHKVEMDRKYREWQDTPATQPALRKARELIWGQSKIAYDQGPMSKIKVLERRRAQYEVAHAAVAALEAAQAESRRVQAALGNTLGEIAAYKGKTVVVKSASIESSLEGLMALKDGMPVDLTLDLLFCGKPRTLEIPWIVGKPGQNAKMVVTALIPDIVQLVNG